MLRTFAFVAILFLAMPVEAKPATKTCWRQVERLDDKADNARRASQKRKYERQASRLAQRCKSRQRPSQADPETVGVATKEIPLPELPDIPVIAPLLDAIRAFLDATALEGQTMEIQGKDVAIGWLHPDFGARLAAALKEAKEAGFEDIGVFSGYRKPALGVGGYKDKAQSCHAYGLAVDMYGIGRPRSQQSKKWYEIATKNGLYNPYGPNHRVEWNHYQGIPEKGCGRFPQLRETITKAGPGDLQTMWRAGSRFIKRALKYVQRGVTQ